MEIWKNSEIVYAGDVVRLRVGEVVLDDGSTARREVVEHRGGVCVLPFTGEAVILVRQFRIAIGDYVMEAPAGKLEGGEDPARRAACELEEETGHAAGRLVPAGTMFASVGYCSEEIHLYLALDLRKTARNPDPEERIELVEVPLRDVRGLLARNAVPDGKTVVILHALLRYLEENEKEEAAP